MRKEAERAEPVVDGDDDRALGGELGAVVVAGGVLRESAPVDPDEHRATASVAAVQSRRGDVEVEAVLVEAPGGTNGFCIGSTCCGQLGANWVASRTPFHFAGGTRGPPPQVPGRGGGVGEAAEGVAAGDGDSADGVALDVDDRGI